MSRLATIGLSGLLMLVASASGGIVIDDKSDFDGADFTVIDFESLGDGSPLVLDEGFWIELDPDEFAAQGVRISAHLNFMGREQAFIGNGIPSKPFDLLQPLVGSPPNLLFAPSEIEAGRLRFDFLSTVNAVGIAAFSNSLGRGERMEAFDSMGDLLASVDFENELVDGTFLGSDYDVEGDLSFGFFGMYLPDASIDHVIITKGLSGFDDLYFGVIPEPTTLLLLFGGGLMTVCRRRKQSHWSAAPLSCSLAGVLMLVASASAGIVLDDKSDFDGADFTVIDFESLGDGSFLILDEGNFVLLPVDEYAAQGVRISAKSDFAGIEQAFVANGIPSKAVDPVHELVGSPSNVLAVRGEGYVRFDFLGNINAIGTVVFSNSNGRGERMEAFDQMDKLLGSLDFENKLVDGIVLGSDYGFEGDFRFGFFGIYLPDASIDHVIITEGASSFDDLHFGVIPEPISATLLLTGMAPWILRRRMAVS